MSRIDPRPKRVGAGQTTSDPDNLDDLRLRQERHERLTRGEPKQPFSKILATRMRDGEPEPEPEPPETREKGAIDPHLGLAPQQDQQLAGGRSTRSAKVIVKG